MMTKLIEIANMNIVFCFFINIFIYVATKCISIYQELSGWIRVKLPLRSKFDGILEYKDKYKGKRCFIVCTGPSLTVDDVEVLKNEYTFGMNSLCLLEGKTDFRPTFFGCIDLIVYKNFKEQIEKFTKNGVKVFVSQRIARKETVRPDWLVLPINVAYHTYDRWVKRKYWCKFSDDCYRTIYDMYSVTHVLIQLAVYMGFTKIYLLGADCMFRKKGDTHFIEYGTLDQDFDSAEERCIAGYEAVSKYMSAHDVFVYNATRGGNLEMFERVRLEDVIGDGKDE